MKMQAILIKNRKKIIKKASAYARIKYELLDY